MPIHDWTRVDAGIFHDFHHAWIEENKRALNRSLKGTDYYALAEQIAGGIARCESLRHGGGSVVGETGLLHQSDSRWRLRRKGPAGDASEEEASGEKAPQISEHAEYPYA